MNIPSPLVGRVRILCLGWPAPFLNIEEADGHSAQLCGRHQGPGGLVEGFLIYVEERCRKRTLKCPHWLWRCSSITINQIVPWDSSNPMGILPYIPPKFSFYLAVQLETAFFVLRRLYNSSLML